MLEKIVVSSKNEGKIIEYRKLFEPLKIEVVPYEGPDIPETGRTFEENARLKAEAACNTAGMAAIGDDSGFCVRSLGDFPGLKSQRFAEECGGYPNAYEKIESMLRGKGSMDAYDICVIAFAAPGEKTRTFEGRVNGFVAYPPRGTNGFGYDPIFAANGMGRTFAELSQDEKIAIDHRGCAFAKLSLYLESLLESGAKKIEKGPAFAPETTDTKVLGSPAPKRRPAKKAEPAPSGEWVDLVKDVRKLKPRCRGAKSKTVAAKAEKIEKAEEFEIEVEEAQIQKADD